MEDFIEGLMTKVGLSKEQADQVVDYIKDNADKLPGMIKSSGVTDMLPDSIGDKLDSLLG